MLKEIRTVNHHYGQRSTSARPTLTLTRPENGGLWFTAVKVPANAKAHSVEEEAREGIFEKTLF